MVLGGDHGQTVLVRVLIDGKPATVSNRGADVSLEQGAGVCRVREARMYTLAQFAPGPTPGEHTLELDLTGSGLRAYAFTFG